MQDTWPIVVSVSTGTAAVAVFVQTIINTYKSSLEIRKLRRELARPAGTPAPPPADTEEKVRQAKATQSRGLVTSAIVLCFGLGLSYSTLESAQRSKQVVQEVAKLNASQEGDGKEFASLRSQLADQNEQFDIANARLVALATQQPGKDSATGKVSGIDEKRLRDLAANWGKYSPEQRSIAAQEIKGDLPPKYHKMIDEYFQSLDKTSKPPGGPAGPPGK